MKEKAETSNPSAVYLLKWILGLLLLLLIISGVAIWHAPEILHGRSLNWTEEVKLPDGRTLKLSRHQEFEGSSMPFQPATESNYWLEFVHPQTAEKIRYEGTRYLQTIFLAIENETPYLVLDTEYTGFERLRCPNPPYQAFRFENQAWSWLPVEKLPMKILKSNMTMSPEPWRKELSRWNAKLGLDVTQSIEINSRPFIVDLTEAPSQALFDGRPFVYQPPELAANRTDPRDLACHEGMKKRYLRSIEKKD